MKKLITFILLYFTTHSVWAQATFTSVSYDKKPRPALMIDLPYDEEVCEGFIVTNLEQTGYNAETKGKLFWKQNKLNGYYIFKDVKLKGLDHTVDLYFKVDEKKRKEESVIFMLVGRGEDYFISNDDDKVYNAAKKFMNDFIEKAAEYKLELDIKKQEELIKEEEKKLNNLKDDEKNMIKKKEDLEKNIQKNIKDQQEQENTLEAQKKKLQDLKSKKS